MAKNCALNRRKDGQPADIRPRICCEFSVTFQRVHVRSSKRLRILYSSAFAGFQADQKADRLIGRMAIKCWPAIKACPAIDVRRWQKISFPLGIQREIISPENHSLFIFPHRWPDFCGLVSGSKNRIAHFTRNAGLPLIFALFAPAVAQHLDRNGGRRLLGGRCIGTALLGHIGGRRRGGRGA